MKVKILNSQNEKKINKELERLEKDRDIERVTPFGKDTWILHCPQDEELQKELKSIRKDFDKLKGDKK